MKKIFTSILLVALTVSMSFGQKTSTDTLVYKNVQTQKKSKCFKNETLFVSVGESFSLLKDLSTGLEIGGWGTDNNPLTYSVIGSFTHNFDSKFKSVFVGLKTYYYFPTTKPYGLYIYGAPQFQAFNTDPSAKKFDFLLEYGGGGYYTVNKHLIISGGIFAQTIYSQLSETGGKPIIPAFGISLNYLR